MAKGKSATRQNGSDEIPRHVANLNRLAERSGLKTSARIGKTPQEWLNEFDKDYEWMHGAAVLSTWTGTKAQLLAMGIFPTSRHIQQRGGWICEPHHGPWCIKGIHPVLCGFIKVSGDNVSLELYGGPRPISIRMVGGVEIVEYPDEIAHHGMRDALISEGICTERELGFKRSCKRSRDWDSIDSPWCQTRRMPDGTFIHWRETEEACKRRVVANREYDARRETESKRNSLSPYDWQNPEAFCEWAADHIAAAVRWALSPKMVTAETRNGYRYTLDPAGVANVLNAMEAAAQGLRTVPVTVVKLVDPAQKKAARDQAASAAVDGAFQRFMGHVAGSLADPMQDN